MKYDDNGNLVLSGKLGEAVVSGEGVEEYAKAMMSGKSENLSYQDMQDFQDFTSEFFVLGLQPSREDWEGKMEAFTVLRKADRAPYGFTLPFGVEPWEDRDFSEGVTMVPMQPFTIQGYEPAE